MRHLFFQYRNTHTHTERKGTQVEPRFRVQILPFRKFNSNSRGPSLFSQKLKITKQNMWIFHSTVVVLHCITIILLQFLIFLLLHSFGLGHFQGYKSAVQTQAICTNTVPYFGQVLGYATSVAYTLWSQNLRQITEINRFS